MHKPLVNSIFLIPFWQVKGYPSCHVTAAGGQEVREALKAAGLCCSTQASREMPFHRGPLPGEHIDPTSHVPLQLGQPPSRSRLLTKGNVSQKHQGYRRLESFLGSSQFTLNGFIWAERRGLDLPSDASAFYVNPTHTWPIFCCSECTVTVYLTQTQQLLGYIWTS